MPCSGQPAAISFGVVESAPTVAFLHGTYEPAAVPVNRRLPLRDGGELRRQAAKLASARLVLTRRYDRRKGSRLRRVLQECRKAPGWGLKHNAKENTHG